ncbi:MAG: hypothetical protein K6B40_05365 [Firmicutes bacterium]|nr:hypothetical protein [Bacillota bacterium]
MKANESKQVPVIVDRIKRAEQWRDENYSQDWRRYYRLYRSQPDEVKEGRSNIFVPATFMQVEVIKARVAESLFASRPYLSILPRGDEDKAQADRLQTLLDWQMNDRMQLPRLFRDKVLHSLCCYGTAVVYTGWLLETRQTRQRAGGARQEIRHNTVVYDDPICQCLDIFDFFVDPNAEDIRDARFCGHREYQTRRQLQNMVRNGKYRLDFSKLSPWEDVEKGQTMRRDDAGKSESEDDFSGQDDNSLYKVDQYWEDDRHVVIVNECQCALDEPNPFWHGMKPYDKCCYTPLPHEFYGVGIPESIESLQKELNTTRNQRVDYYSLALRRMWKVRKGCGITPRDLVWRQNGVLQVENMDDVQEIQVATMPGTAFSNESSIKQDMRDTTGCHDVIMGLSQRSETATTTMTKDNNASLRFKSVVAAVVNNLLTPVGKKCLALDQQFLTEKRLIRLLNEDGDRLLHISPEELAGDYDLYYVGAAAEPLANKEMIKNRTMEAFQLASRHPLYQNDPEALLRFLERVFRALDIENVKELLPDLRKTAGEEQKKAGPRPAGDDDSVHSLAAVLAAPPFGQAAGNGGGAAAGLDPAAALRQGATAEAGAEPEQALAEALSRILAGGGA